MHSLRPVSARDEAFQDLQTGNCGHVLLSLGYCQINKSAAFSNCKTTFGSCGRGQSQRQGFPARWWGHRPSSSRQGSLTCLPLTVLHKSWSSSTASMLIRDMTTRETLPGEPQAFAFIFPLVFHSGRGRSGCKYRNIGVLGRQKAEESTAVLGVNNSMSERR